MSVHIWDWSSVDAQNVTETEIYKVKVHMLPISNHYSI